MFFEAELKGTKYHVHVNETRTHWKVSLQPDGGEWKHHNISKEDFQLMDSAVSFLFNNSSYMIDVVGAGTEYTVYTRGSFRVIPIKNDEMLLHESLKSGGQLGGGDSLTAGMPGKIVKVMVEKGQSVTAGQPLLIMEAMKMENEMRAPMDTTIKKVMVKDGQSVESGALLITFESTEKPNDKKA